MDPSFKNFTSPQHRFSQLLNLKSDFARSSPILKEPKKATHIVVHMTDFVETVQSFFAISWPIIFSKDKDIAFLGFLEDFLLKERFSTPLREAFT